MTKASSWSLAAIMALGLSAPACGGSGDDSRGEDAGGSGGRAVHADGGGSPDSGAGQGGAGGSGSCGQVQPCGGDPTGSWKVIGSCVNAAAFIKDVDLDLSTNCPQQTVSAASLAASGDLSLGSDLSYSIAVTFTEAFMMSEPASCLTGGTTCGTLAAFLESNGATTASCSGNTTCSCSVTIQMPANETGTYSTAGTTLTSVAAGSTSGDPGAYCVQGGVLHLIEVDSQGVIDDDVVLQKQ